MLLDQDTLNKKRLNDNVENAAESDGGSRDLKKKRSLEDENNTILAEAVDQPRLAQ
jgi:hypothetical protein